MNMNLVYTDSAKEDLKAIFNYIAFDLSSPNTAEKILEGIFCEIRALEESPELFPLYRDNPWRDLGIRSFPVKNYVMFYIADMKTNTVSILRVMYGGRDMNKQLEENPGLN